MHTIYYAGKKPFVTGRLYIHKAECPFLPEERMLLGSFNSVYAAIESRKFNYGKQEPCPFCCKEQLHFQNREKASTIGKPFVDAFHFAELKVFMPGTYIN
ncbi:MAG TPA: hypothetical protein PK064_01770 [Bacteroidales bacterium]|nr:hypothetical protein [Bacteroidales bacterium]